MQKKMIDECRRILDECHKKGHFYQNKKVVDTFAFIFLKQNSSFQLECSPAFHSNPI